MAEGKGLSDRGPGGNRLEEGSRRGGWLDSVAIGLVVYGVWYLLFGRFRLSDVFFSALFENMGYIDLYPTFVASKLFQAGEYGSIYHPELFLESAKSMHTRWLEVARSLQIINFGTSFVYGPLYLMLVAPFVAVFDSFTTLRAISVFVNAMSIGIICGECLRLADRRSLLEVVGCALCAAVFFPFGYAAYLGQNTIPAVACALLSFRSLQRGGVAGRGGACFLVILACACKPWFIMLLGGFLALREWKIPIWTGICYILFFLWMPGFLVPGELSEGYWAVNRQLVRLSLLAWNNLSLRGFLHRLSFPSWGDYLGSFVRVPPPVFSVYLAEGVVLLLFFAIFIKGLRPGQQVRNPGTRKGGGVDLAGKDAPDSSDPSPAASAGECCGNPSAVFLVCLSLMILPCGVSWHHYLACVFPLALTFLLTRKADLKVRLMAGGFLLFESLPVIPSCFYGNITPQAVHGSPELWASVFFLPTLLSILLAVAVIRFPVRG